MKAGIVVPHIFMHRDILPGVIFSPATLALELAQGLQAQGVKVALFTPGPVNTPVTNITADLSYFEHELNLRGDTYLELLKKHPFTFVTLARQVQSELLAKAFIMANQGKLDLVHVYTNEEDIALPFAILCHKPVVFTHHDPFNFLVKYKNIFPKYAHLNWLSISFAQRRGMPADTCWAGNIYHGVDRQTFTPNYRPAGDYVAYLGRIIEPKGVHLAIQAIKLHNKARPQNKLKLKLAGKHYAGYTKDTYWQERIQPETDGSEVEYVGFIDSNRAKQAFLGNAAALLVPSTFEEPFGMVMIEALACGTPLIGLDSGAIAEVIQHGLTGMVVKKRLTRKIAVKGEKPEMAINEKATAEALARAISKIQTIDRQACRQDFEIRFTAERMCREHAEIYKKLAATENPISFGIATRSS